MRPTFSQNYSRRSFIGTSASAAFAFTFLPSRVFGANDRLRIAGVGVGGHASGPAMFVVTLFYVNVGLAIFNLLPLPPLDGSQLLPRSFDGFKQAVAPYSFLLLMVVINVRTLREPLLEVPFRLAVHGLQSLVGLRLLADGAF